ncbi:hypothetical protein YC2023_058209 [Brassica napus]
MNRNSDITLGGRGEKLQRKQSRESPLGGQVILRRKEERLKRAKCIGRAIKIEQQSDMKFTNGLKTRT